MLWQIVSLLNVIADTLLGRVKYVSPDESEQRLCVCRKCEHLFFANCKKCLCFMPLKVKYRFEHCSIGKW